MNETVWKTEERERERQRDRQREGEHARETHGLERERERERGYNSNDPHSTRVLLRLVCERARPGGAGLLRFKGVHQRGE